MIGTIIRPVPAIPALAMPIKRPQPINTSHWACVSENHPQVNVFGSLFPSLSVAQLAAR